MVGMVHSGLTASIPVADMSALIAQLEAAAGGSQALTDDTLKALGFVMKRYPMDSDRYWIVPGDDRHPLPPWCDKITVSLDAALALGERVLPGWRKFIEVVGDGRGSACVFLAHEAIDRPWSHAPTPALALCIAILRSKLDRYEAEGGVNNSSLPPQSEGAL